MDVKTDERDPQTYAIIGAAMEVHRELGHGFLEAVYKEAMAIELLDRKIPFEREVPLTIHYKGRPLACKYRADFLCQGNIIVEAKAISALTGVDRAQTLHYQAAAKIHRALPINFGQASVKCERMVWGPPNPGSPPTTNPRAQSAAL